ncbi:MAG: TPM domain-containing protein, partial [Bacteroidia bacterium]
MKVNNFFSDTEKKQIVDAIVIAEKNTSGEIRVHLEETCPENVYEHAVTIFGKLEMHKTEQQNAVLFYLATKDKKFAIVADKGINDV